MGAIATTAAGRAALTAAAADLLERLRQFGLLGVQELKLTRNRRTMVSIRGRTLRLHAAYVDAPPPVLQAIADFVMAKRRDERRAAGRAVVAWSSNIPVGERRPRATRTHDDDAPLAEHFTALHRALNAECFGGGLGTVPVRISRRMRRRLGHYTPRAEGVEPEIAISWQHVRRQGLADAAITLLHEMVHQWQDEAGHAVDHGEAFRRKAREVGIPPRATRRVD